MATCGDNNLPLLSDLSLHLRVESKLGNNLLEYRILKKPNFTQLVLGIRIVLMEIHNLDEESPTPVGEENQEKPNLDNDKTPLGKKRRGWWTSWLLWGLLGLFLIILFITAGSYLGYQQGIDDRKGFEATQVALAIEEQYDLGVQDLEAGNYEVARQRFDYVIQIDPNYPGVLDHMAEVLLVLNATATPTPVPTVTPIPITPTPDLRGQEELFIQAQNHIANEQWDEAIKTMETLRKNDPTYQAIELDGMFYVAYRNRGARNIGAGNLEQGIYDLTLAERFGVLDTEAVGYRTWARYYNLGASFWGVDWAQAIYYFEQVAPQYPNMHDGTGWTASQRYVEAIVGYAQWFEAQDDWCSAEEQYDRAYELTEDPDIRRARNNASDNCN
jgi:tetratricopeptide (TPR) repeat protein